MHHDGGATELLRPKDVAEFATAAAADPAVAFMEDPLTEFPWVTGGSVMKPYVKNRNAIWLRDFEEDNIIPKGKQKRSLAERFQRG